MSTISFTVNSLIIRNTRSAHQDTNYVALSLSKNGSPVATQVVDVGDQNSGTHGINVSVTIPATYAPADRFTLNYLVLNHGGDLPPLVSQCCTSIFLGYNWNAYNASDATPAGNWTTALPACMVHAARGSHRADWWNEIQHAFQTLIQQRCDGPVAMDSFSFQGSSIPAIIAAASQARPLSFDYPGIDSPGGCGSNSDYSVHWYATRQ
jgi:hypothetical protein